MLPVTAKMEKTEDSAWMGTKSPNISGQQRGQEQRATWGEEKGRPLDGHEQGKASQELYFRKSFIVFLLGMGELRVLMAQVALELNLCRFSDG